MGVACETIKPKEMNRCLYHCILCMSLLLIKIPSFLSLTWSRSTSMSGGFGLLFDPCHSGCQCYDHLDSDNNLSENNTAIITSKKRFMVVCNYWDLDWLYQYEIDYVDMAQQIPDNTTNLEMWKFPSLNVGMVLFRSILHPLLLNLTIHNCMQLDLLPGAFSGKMFYSVKSINISHNFMKSDKIREKIFSLLVSLEELVLVRNYKLDVIETRAFNSLPLVTVINLTGNYIKEIHPGAFHNLPQLTSLDLSYNRPEAIPGEDIIHLPSLKWLVMDGNLWDCSCEIGWILFLDKSIISESSHAMCHYPPELNGTLLHQLNFNHFRHCCPVHIWMSIVIGYPVLFLLSLITCVCVYLYWKSLSQKALVECGQIIFYTTATLNSSSNVFKGKLKDGRDVAIKKVPHVHKERLKELQILLHLFKIGPPHPNVVQYLIKEVDNDATYIALALYKGNLGDLLSYAVSKKDMNVVSQLTCQRCLWQITFGLAFLHRYNIQHRDIKPSNILWDEDSSGKYRFIVSDLDLGHFSEDQSSNKSGYDSMGWSAPELWGTGERTIAVDIFSLGLVFFYVLTKGGHPFASPVSNTVQENIIENKFCLENLVDHCNESVAQLAIDLIGSMIHYDAKQRPSATDVLQHPLFWTLTEQVKFYHEIGNLMENKQDSSQLVQRLEQQSEDVFQGSWMDRLNKAVRKDVDGFKKQQTSICGLLRVIRNKTEHFMKLRPELKAIYNDSPGGVVNYYNTLFPKLLLYTYRARNEAKGHLEDTN